MSASGNPSILKKLYPTARMPAAAVLQRFSPLDRRLIAQTVAEPLECVYDPMFRRAAAARELLKPLPELDDVSNKGWSEAGGALDVLSPPRHRVLTAEQERWLFLRFNYCRYRLMRVLQAHRGKRLGMQASREAVQWAREALRTRNHIVRANTCLLYTSPSPRDS